MELISNEIGGVLSVTLDLKSLYIAGTVCNSKILVFLFYNCIYFLYNKTLFCWESILTIGEINPNSFEFRIFWKMMRRLPFTIFISCRIILFCISIFYQIYVWEFEMLCTNVGYKVIFNSFWYTKTSYNEASLTTFSL